MTSVGVTGHQMRDGIDWPWVRAEIGRALDEEEGATELWTGLATGADTIAAEEAIGRGIATVAVIPHEDYESAFSDADCGTYRSLLDRSGRIVRLEPEGDDREAAYLAAGLRVADESDLLLVVWDGRPAAGKGGTGDIAAYARDRGTRVVWLDTSRSRTRPLAEAAIPSD